MFTVVYVSEDGMIRCFGKFAERRNAQKVADREERKLDADRDVAGGGVGSFYAVHIERIRGER